MLNALRAEWIKMWTVRSALVATILMLIAGILNGVLVGLLQGRGLVLAGAAASDISLFPAPYLMATTNIGLLILMVLSTVSVTNEYSSYTIESSFRAVPRRWQVFTAKLLVYSAYAAVLSLVTAILSLLAGKLSLGSNMNMLHVMGKAAWGHYWRIVVAAVLMTMFGLAMGMILRRTGAAVALTLVWMFAVEPILGNLPKYGSDILPFLPFQNLLRFSMNISNGLGLSSFHWSSEMSGLYFFGIAVVLWLIGLLVVAPTTFAPIPKVQARAAKKQESQVHNTAQNIAQNTEQLTPERQTPEQKLQPVVLPAAPASLDPVDESEPRGAHEL